MVSFPNGIYGSHNHRTSCSSTSDIFLIIVSDIPPLPFCLIEFEIAITPHSLFGNSFDFERNIFYTSYSLFGKEFHFAPYFLTSSMGRARKNNFVNRFAKIISHRVEQENSIFTTIFLNFFIFLSLLPLHS